MLATPAVIIIINVLLLSRLPDKLSKPVAWRHLAKNRPQRHSFGSRIGCICMAEMCPYDVLRTVTRNAWRLVQQRLPMNGSVSDDVEDVGVDDDGAIVPMHQL